jgi:flagellar assembly factor FliW
MNFKNRRFGKLDFEGKHVITFSQGLIGFEESRKFLIVDDEDSQPFRWLVSLEDPEMSFPLLDPELVVPDYNILQREEKKSTFVVATLRERVEESTINLRSPIVIDNTTRNGKQVVLEDDSLSLQHPLLSQPAHLLRNE